MQHGLCCRCEVVVAELSLAFVGVAMRTSSCVVSGRSQWISHFTAEQFCWRVRTRDCRSQASELAYFHTSLCRPAFDKLSSFGDQVACCNVKYQRKLD